MIKHLQGFLKLLDRYQKNTSTDNEKKIMDTWYDSIDHTAERQNAVTEEEAGKAMWSVISKGMSEQEHEAPSRLWSYKFYFRLAAACLLLAGGFVLYRTAFDHDEAIAGVKNEVIEKMQSVANPGPGPKVFTLADGSRVTLEKDAVLYYPERFTSNERNVFLKGNVFFEIAHDSSRPFYVHANNIVTRVLGTSFTVRENPKTNSIEVAVMTGVVEVRQAAESGNSQQTENKVILTQNKKVTFFEETEKLVTGLVDQPKIIKNKPVETNQKLFNYVEMPFSGIIPILEDAYGVKISLDERLRNCTITADLSQENTLFAQLEILCESIDARYELNKDTIMLSGKGCELSK